MDVHYPEGGGAVAAAVYAADERFSVVDEERTARLAVVAPYRPGAFYERELPAIREVLGTADDLRLLVVDGYVRLDPEGRPGLGAYAYEAFGVPVIGVAKSAFRSATHAIEVRRGTAVRPLYVTAAGMPAERAAALVRGMAGEYRLPTALRRADRLSRTGLPG